MHDLLLANVHLLDPGRGLDLKGDIAFAQGRVAAIGAGLDRTAAREVRDLAGALVVPGLIDLHTHIYRDATPLSVDADLLLRRSGTTTAVDAGSAGAGGIAGLFSLVAPVTTARLLAFVNIGHAGILAAGSTCTMPEAEDLRLLHVGACAAALRRHRPHTVGVKVRVGRSSTGTLGAAALHMAIRAAEEAAGSGAFVPVMVHIGADMPPTIEEILDPLRPGDILTHCCSPKSNSVLAPDGSLRACARAARERGVLFDIAHGQGSFGFATARRMLELGVVPDVISSDVHSGCVDGPAFDVLVSMSKMLALGMTLPEVVRRATATPAAAIARPDLGTLVEGGIGDATVLEVVEAPTTLTDSISTRLEATRRLACRGAVVAGAWQAAGA
jgi:dihydroorotase